MLFFYHPCCLLSFPGNPLSADPGSRAVSSQQGDHQRQDHPAEDDGVGRQSGFHIITPNLSDQPGIGITGIIHDYLIKQPIPEAEGKNKSG